MQFVKEYLQQIAIDICQTMLGIELIPVDSDMDATRQLVASVTIHGNRDTIVEVFANDQLMTTLAEGMFCSAQGALSAEEVRDAFGEIANIIGGNIKGVVGDEAQLSLPTIGNVDDWHTRFPDGCLHATFQCCGNLLTIAIGDLERNTSVLAHDDIREIAI